MDAFGTGTFSQLSQQFGAESPALPFVHDGDGDLGGLRVLPGPDIPGDAHATPVARIHRAERLMVVMVDLGEAAQLHRGQFLLYRQEPQLARSSTQPGEAVGQQRSISALDRPYQHLRPVTEHCPLALDA